MAATLPRLAVCNELFRGWSFAQAADYAASLGYAGLEVAPMTLMDDSGTIAQTNVAAVGDSAAASGLEVIGLHWLLARTQGLHVTEPDPATRHRTAEYLARLSGLCRELGGSVMVLGSPQQRNLPPGTPGTAGIEPARACIEQTLPALEANRVTLAIEPLGPQETNFLNSAAEAVELIRQINSPWVRLHLDVKAMSTEDSPIPEIIRRYHRELVHFHANDANRRGPGMGEIDFVPILRALRQIDYCGWISVEVFDETLGIEALARESIENLRRDWARALAEPARGPNSITG
jgi:sugar phosphate isomerase/epimerase